MIGGRLTTTSFLLFPLLGFCKRRFSEWPTAERFDFEGLSVKRLKS